MDVLRRDLSNSWGGPSLKPTFSPLKILHPERNFIFQPSIHQFSGASCWVSGNCKSSPLSSIKSCNLKIDGWKATFLKGAWIFFQVRKTNEFQGGPIPSWLLCQDYAFLEKGIPVCFSLLFFLLSVWRVNHHTKVSWLLKNGYACITSYSLIHLLHMQVIAGYCIIQILMTRIPC